MKGETDRAMGVGVVTGKVLTQQLRNSEIGRCHYARWYRWLCDG
jgi:hypothetical protein